jgi:NAD(P)-dependent dehydrogenase (short-subunit alcohol dehydrogenase family)
VVSRIVDLSSHDWPAPYKTRVALVTGANKGIGFETARQLGEAGLTVVLGARDPDRGRTAADALRDLGLAADAVQLDVTDEASVKAAACAIATRFDHLDVLVNNAGILVEGDFPAPSQVTLEKVRATFETNFFGALAVTRTMLPLLRRAPAARIVNVSSHLASLGRASAGLAPSHLNLLAYNTAKTALNAATVQYALELKGTPIKVNAVDPGHCATDINGHNAERSAAEAARIPVRYALLPADGPSGGFYGEDGPLPW